MYPKLLQPTGFNEENVIIGHYIQLPLPVKRAAHKFDYALCILCFSAIRFLINVFEGQAHLQFAMVES